MKAVEGKKIFFAYGKETILEDVTFAIEQGDFVGLIGPNGGGKSTLIKLILGLEKPAFGKISVLGGQAGDRNNWRKIGYVPQSINPRNFPFPITAGEMLALTGASKLEIKAKLAELQIENLESQPMTELSGGQAQKVYIARAMLHEPELLILDEPTTGLDAEAEGRLFANLRRLNQSGVTILLASHDIARVAEASNLVLCLNKRLVCHGRPEKILRNQLWEQVFGKHTLPVRHGH